MGHADYIWNVCVYTERLVWTELSLFIFGHSEGGGTDRGKKRKKQLLRLWPFMAPGQTAALSLPGSPPLRFASSIFFFLFEFLQCDENCCQQKEEAKAKADAHIAHQPYLAWHLIFIILIQCFSSKVCKKKNSEKQTLRNVKISGAGG